MRWSERQLAMLREMGIRVWAPASAEAVAETEGAVLVAERTFAPAAAPVAAPTMRAPAAPAYASGTALPAPGGADWLVVGEPFLSPAADAAEEALLLDNMLRAIGVSREAASREGRAVHLALEAARATDLDAALGAVRPRCILALGRAPALALLGLDEPLGRLRERTHERAGVPVVVTFALPYLLRHAADKPRAWADLCRAVAAMA